MQRRCDKVAAKTFSRKLLKGLRYIMRVLGHDTIETTAIYPSLSGAEAAREYWEKW